jgi:RNA-directed DNA polymerase
MKLELIAEKARQHKKLKFTSLMHNFNEENLALYFKTLRKNRASGINGVTAQEYEANLDKNIADLVVRLKSKWYKPQPVRRVYIPKPGKGGLRPLGIPCVEDKLVQMVLKELLEAIFEQDFLECSYGFRPNQNCHMAIKELDNVVMHKPINYIVEVDIEKFFDTVEHEWLMKCLGERVADPNIFWLVRKFLKAGIMEDNQFRASELGTPQGGVVSPLLANIYLHYVLDLWFEKIFKPKAKGHVQLIRYCDDFIVACESESDAKRFLPELELRLAKFNLKISKDKTRSLKFGRRAWRQSQRTGKKMETFDFLGFTHYCSKSRNGYFVMGHKTSRQRTVTRLKEFTAWMKNVKNVLPLKELWTTVKAKLIGHYNYFGINGNLRWLQKYYRDMIWIFYKWINRRSQKRSMSLEEFWNYLKWNPLPTPRIHHYILYKKLNT